MTKKERDRAWRLGTEKGRSNHATWKLNQPASYLLRKAKDRANKKGLECTLTKEWIETRLPAGCEVTGLPFVYAMGSAKRHNPWSPSIDRKNSNEGYTPDNCRLVVWMYNVAKSTWTDEEVLIMAKALI